MSTAARMPLGISPLVRYVLWWLSHISLALEAPYRDVLCLDALALVSLCFVWYGSPLTKAIWWP